MKKIKSWFLKPKVAAKNSSSIKILAKSYKKLGKNEEARLILIKDERVMERGGEGGEERGREMGRRVRSSMRLHQLQMALMVPDDSLPCLLHLKNIFCAPKHDIFQLG